MTDGTINDPSDGEIDDGAGAELDGGTLAESLAHQARTVLDRHWQPEGYTVPNGDVYPHQWLWDSCFHSIIWAHLGEADRAVTELANVFAHQGDDGFVPHMTYWRAPTMHASFWGRTTTSSITQPPMYGHAIAELARLGIGVDRSVVDAARAGLHFLLDRRVGLGRGPDAGAGAGLDGGSGVELGQGLVGIVHPWESGCDDSPRWDAWCPGGYEPRRWRQVKGDLVAALRPDPVTGSTVGSDAFAVASTGFNALVAFNLAELDSVSPSEPSAPGSSDRTRAVARRLRSCWDTAQATFVDPGGHGSAAVRTLEALLPVVTLDPVEDAPVLDAVFAQVRSATAFGGACGPAQVHRDEPAFDPARYWRGPTWPQLTYLLWVAARRAGRRDDAAGLAHSMAMGARRSGFAEYWHPDDGTGFGAVPQSWTGLAAVMAGHD